SIGSAGPSVTGEWTYQQARAKVRRYIDQVYVRFTGSGEVRAWVDDVTLERGWPPVARAPKPPVQGYATERVVESLGRGLVAVPLAGERIYLSWRLLADDPPDVGFHVHRAIGRGRPQRLTDEPITRTCDFIDAQPIAGRANSYFVRPVIDGAEGEASAVVDATPAQEGRPWVSIPLQGDYTFQKAGIADLDGDGQYDFVIKQPNANIDPYELYWERSPETYKLEAYLADGSFLWRYDLGWGIERGIWYSPYIVHDLDGDGRAEVAVKTGPEGDPRDEDGRVTSGPEYLTILDGMTGEVRAQVEWPSRDEFPSYNYASRNLMCVAYLDGRTPCLIVDRGTYNVMIVVAYQFHDGTLQELWRWRDSDEGGMYRGQGAHSMHAADVDGDGRDEVFLGSAVLDDNGVGLWSSGMGHPDHHYVGDIDPTRPGLEVYYGMETRQSADGCWLADAATGEWLWGLEEPTTHVHATGMCADIDARYPGMECYSGERDFPEKRWLWSAQGELIAMADLGGLAPRALYWDADPQRELIRGSQIQDFRGATHADWIRGSIVGFADVLGDWREEIIATLPGELRIYVTTIPAEDRRVCLMQDPIYRADVAIQAMGYTQCPMTSTCFCAGQPNLALVLDGGKVRAGEPATAEVVLTAPADRALRGTVRLMAGQGVTLGADTIEVEVLPGQIGRYPLTLTLAAGDALSAAGSGQVGARFEGEGRALTAALTVELLDEPMTDRPRTQAEAIAAQGGGTVQIREDKVGADGTCFSHWDAPGHWLEWTMSAPQAGRYRLAVRYCAQTDARRSAAIDGRPLGEFAFPATGGFSSDRNDWRHRVLQDPQGAPLLIELSAGEHTLRMTNTDGKGMNVDYLMLIAQ
ncbi:MAG: carbohydrate-binding domain-containing protein, partial [Armatimonadota bacterium]